jgi:hypothetical protein
MGAGQIFAASSSEIRSLAVFSCSAPWVKITERYWLPTSLPWRFGVVGSWMAKKALQQRAVVDHGGIEAHLDHLGVTGIAAADAAVIRVPHLPAGIAGDYRRDAGQLHKGGFQAPEAAAAQCGNGSCKFGVAFAVHSILPQRKLMGQTMVFRASGAGQNSSRRPRKARHGSTPVSFMQRCVDDQVRR